MPGNSGGTLTQNHYDEQVKLFLKEFSASSAVSFEKLPAEAKNALLFGAKDFEGVIPNLRRIYEKTTSEGVSKRLSGYMSHHVCPACKGARLRPEALSVRIAGRSIHEIMSFTVEESVLFF